MSHDLLINQVLGRVGHIAKDELRADLQDPKRHIPVTAAKVAEMSKDTIYVKTELPGADVYIPSYIDHPLHGARVSIDAPYLRGLDGVLVHRSSGEMAGWSVLDTRLEN
jgi:hypothetical protein